MWSQGVIMEKTDKSNQDKPEAGSDIFLSDAPIASQIEDILGRKKFAQALCRNILQHKDKDTIVIGLYGTWGCGKSSIINMVLDDMHQRNENKPLIIRFNPWNFSEQDSLVAAFFNEIANSLNYKDSPKQAKKLSEKLKVYGHFLSSALLVSSALRVIIPALFLLIGFVIAGTAYFPGLKTVIGSISAFFILFGTVLVFSKKLMDVVSDFLLEWSKFNEKTLQQLKNELNALILKQERRFLIVIDDVDRLNTKEIRQIFQLVKLNADFNNTMYLLAFDRKIIEQSLEEQKGVSGKDYLEKIVQVSFDVPLVQESKLYSYLFAQLDKIIKPVQDRLWDMNRWNNLFHACLRDFFSSLRDVKRYINSLKFNFSLIQQGDSLELNPIDFIGLEVIRVFAPTVYDAIRSENRLLTQTSSGIYGAKDDTEERKTQVDAIINTADEGLRKSVKEMIFHLFPQVKGLYGNVHYGSESQSGWTKELRICSTELFDRYFILDVPEGELSQFEINKLLNAISSDKNTFSQLLEEHLKNGRIKKVLMRLEDYKESLDLVYAQNLIIPLLDISDKLPDETVAFFDTRSDMHIMRIIYHYLKRIEDKQNRSSVLKEAIKNSKGMFGCVEKVSIELQGREKHPENERIIIDSDVEEFKSLCLEKIRKFAREGDLAKHRRLASIIYDWIRWGGREEVQKFVSDLISTDEGLVCLIKGFLSQSQSFGMGDYTARTNWKMSYKNLKEFIDLDKAKERLGKIDLNKLDEKERFAVETFLKDFDKRDKPDHDY